MDSDATEATVVKKPAAVWGGAATQSRGQLPQSLSDVMSEQLAHRILEEQESLRVEQMLRDESVALSLQSQFNTEIAGGEVKEPGATDAAAAADAPAAADAQDSDLAIAMQLQREFDQEYNRGLKLEEERLNRDQKIRVSLSSHRRPEGATDEASPGDAEEEFSYDDDDDAAEFGMPAGSAACPAGSAKSRGGRRGGRGGPASVTKHDPEVTGRRNAERMSTRFGLGFREGDTSGMDIRLDNRVYNALRRHAEAAERRAPRLHDKRDRGTAEAALDEKTRTILFKQVSAGRFVSLGGVIATGKESVVLHAYCSETSQTPAGKPMPSEVAIKVFKTTLNEFKARSDYVTGDPRVSKDALKWQNPRKVMRVWCEKELLNLRTLARHGLPCPQGVMLRGHVLVMSFIGEAGCAAPRLKDCRLEPQQLVSAWEQTVSHLCRLYRDCQLVHADFSEYNLLWWCDTVWIIDVSQSVNLGHPKALDFLLRDCRNVCEFFAGRARRSGGTAGPGEPAADFVVSPEELFNRVTRLGVAGSGEEFEKRLADYLASRQDFEGDRVHLEHGLERWEFQFDHFFDRDLPGDVGGGDGEPAEGEESSGEDDWVEAEDADADSSVGEK